MKPYTLALPADYRVGDVLSFHRRDAESIAEQVAPERLRKGVLLEGVPVVLDLALSPASASVNVDADGKLSKAAQEQAREAVLNILGLRIDPAPFSAFVKKDQLFAALARRQPGLRIVQSATVFEALTWAIIGQQINLSFAIALRRTFILLAGRQHSSGLWCYPDARSAAALSLDDLTSRKFSRAKAETLLRLAQLITAGELQLDLTSANSIEQISAALLAVKGIGPWTVNYGLLRGYGYADCSLHGDVAVRAALQTLLGDAERPDIKRTEEILARYSPHRTMAAAHLWASLHDRDAG
ncbi:DNA-3-methyladenine glycosylase family protein [Duganella callida]|uniref:DNA-3-methyladenine glycosylase II n=1 Tax=Duganella callida TaxID=2561932 RepID=A0A4Y9S523_9BURK|nr:DNA-3-methyladenine glycosylase 2 [Duganella callida]TFW14955.1 DNA-3-methyladenine glycosylase 2 [Duganella callida]